MSPFRRVLAVAAILWLSASSLAMAGFTTPPGIDTTAPTLTTAPQTVAVAQTSVTLRWVTDEIADSQVSYGPTGSATTRVTGELDQVSEHLITLTNLTANTAYSYSVQSTDPSGNTFTSQTFTFTTASAPDTAAPGFSAGPSIVSIADTSAVVSWSSNEPTTATVSFGAGNTNQQIASPTLALSHNVTLTGLLPGTNYSVRVDMADLAANTSASSVQNFTTTGIAPAPGVGISTNSLSFGNQAQGSTNSQPVTLTNTGSATMTINSISVTGDFGQSNTCGASVNVNTSCTISVSFTPTTTGTRTGSLTIISNASGSPHSVSLSGTGTLALVSLSQNLVTGFNLLGNSLATPIDVVTTFGNAGAKTTISDQTLTVWKWVLLNGIGKWAFHAPSLTQEQNATYAANSGFAVLTTINPKEGYWVNAASPYTLTLPAAVATTFTNNDFANNLDWPRGFNLIAIGSAMTPTQFNNTVAQSPPLASGALMSANLVSLWAWNATLTRWYFYAPSLERDGGLAAVKAYADAQGFLDFNTDSKLLELGMGFWVNRP